MLIIFHVEAVTNEGLREINDYGGSEFILLTSMRIKYSGFIMAMSYARRLGYAKDFCQTNLIIWDKYYTVQNGPIFSRVYTIPLNRENHTYISASVKTEYLGNRIFKVRKGYILGITHNRSSNCRDGYIPYSLGGEPALVHENRSMHRDPLHIELSALRAVNRRVPLTVHVAGIPI